MNALKKYVNKQRFYLKLCSSTKVFAVILLSCCSIKASCQQKEILLVFELDYEVDTVLILKNNDTLFNKVLTTNQIIGNAGAFRIKYQPKDHLFIIVNNDKKLVSVRSTKYFGIQYERRKIGIKRYLKPKAYD
jgi:hypothetical protein